LFVSIFKQNIHTFVKINNIITMPNIHEHHPEHQITSLNKAYIGGIILNSLFVVIEFAAGFWINSMGLISDAGHNLGDVAAILLSLLAFRLSHVKNNETYTYGYKKSTVLVSLLNSFILLITLGFILTESIRKIIHPQPLDGSVMAWVAGIGVFVNGATAFLFMKDKDKDLNVRGVFLHMAADALVSIGVVASGIIISFTGWYIIDPIIGLVISIVIITSTWNLLHDSIRLSLDGVPENINYDNIEDKILKTENVCSIHHLHIWALSTTENALTAHIVVDDLQHMEQVKHVLREKLSKIGIGHATFEFENKGEHCECEND